MEGFVINRVELGVDVVDKWGGVFSFTKDAPTVDVMEDGIELMRLVGETAIVMEDVPGPLGTRGLRFMSDADGRFHGRRGSGRGCRSGARLY